MFKMKYKNTMLVHKEMKKIFLLLSLSLLLESCPMDYEHGFAVKNNSNKIIVVTGGYILPDTLLPINHNKLITINKDERRSIFGSSVGDPDIQLLRRGEVLTLFILDKDTVDSHSWEYIRKKNVILRRFEFNYQELKGMGFTITVK